ncbi:hypothetical protein P0Y67_16830 [Photobacterium sp. SP02]|uniref:hypothetical protein n=1 Tax=Photobacterium sp. SP02 TaxID=3032280 RepID=UPI003145265B
MKFLKIIAGILATILLGAIGSGLWERVLSPALDELSRAAIRLVDGIYTGYLDSIYKSAAYDLPNIYQQKIAALILIIVGLVWIGTLVKNYNWWEKLIARLPEDKCSILSTTYTTLFRAYSFLIALSLFTMGMFLISKADYVQKTNAYSHQSLEILHPYVGTERYLMLKSEYYRVTSSSSFEKFNSQIKTLANKHQIMLPEFKVVE